MDNKKWFKEAKMGMFIHWGLYSLPAGEWKGKRTEYPSEWVMTYNRIPIKEYEKLAGIFNPIYFDAEEWVKLAKEADAVDIDPNAINIAYENSDMNDIPREKYHVCAGNILEDQELHQKYSGKKYDMVEANIVADIIIRMMPDVGELMDENSVILASGIIIERSEDVITQFVAHGFEIVERIDENGWCALAVKKK